MLKKPIKIHSAVFAHLWGKALIDVGRNGECVRFFFRGYEVIQDDSLARKDDDGRILFTAILETMGIIPDVRSVAFEESAKNHNAVAMILTLSLETLSVASQPSTNERRFRHFRPGILAVYQS